jgi:hypothetical protein
MRIICGLLFLIAPLLSGSQVHIDTSYNAQRLVESFMGEGVSVFNIRMRGYPGSFAYFHMNRVHFPMKEGVLLSTGRASSCANPNLKGNTSTSIKGGAGSDTDLEKMVSKRIFNATVLEFDFIPIYDSLFFDYVFASEEYPEYVGSAFNDVFCLMISGPGFKMPVNLARVGKPETTVMINTVNHKKNSAFFVPNYNFTPNQDIPYIIEYDGFTTLLTAACKVSRGKIYHLKIAIGNVNDFNYDSGVFLRAGSFGSKGDAMGKSRFILPFHFDSYDVEEKYSRLFDSLAGLMKQHPAWKIAVLGHTDSTGTKEYNDHLSEKRALEVAGLLVSSGVPSRQLFIKGYGFSKPLSDNNSEEGKQKNRRVEILIQRRD